MKLLLLLSKLVMKYKAEQCYNMQIHETGRRPKESCTFHFISLYCDHACQIVRKCHIFNSTNDYTKQRLPITCNNEMYNISCLWVYWTDVGGGVKQWGTHGHRYQSQSSRTETKQFMLKIKELRPKQFWFCPNHAKQNNPYVAFLKHVQYRTTM